MLCYLTKNLDRSYMDVTYCYSHKLYMTEKRKMMMNIFIRITKELFENDVRDFGGL